MMDDVGSSPRPRIRKMSTTVAPDYDSVQVRKILLTRSKTALNLCQYT